VIAVERSDAREDWQQLTELQDIRGKFANLMADAQFSTQEKRNRLAALWPGFVQVLGESSNLTDPDRDRIAGLIYVSAVIPRNGESLVDWGSRAPESMTVPNMKVDEVNGTVSLDENISRAAFFHDCSAQDAADALERMRPSPLAPLASQLLPVLRRVGE